MQTLTRHQERIVLPSADTPTDYYNIQADLGERLPPPLDPQTRQPANPAMLERIFAKELIRQEIRGETYGARVSASPSTETKYGQSLLAEDPNHPGTLGIAITEALEDTVTHEDTRYCLGSVLNHVLLHQSILGLETKKQLDSIGVTPDIIAGCIGGGLDFAGLAYPFIGEQLKGGLDGGWVAVCAEAGPATTGV